MARALPDEMDVDHLVTDHFNLIEALERGPAGGTPGDDRTQREREADAARGISAPADACRPDQRVSPSCATCRGPNPERNRCIGATGAVRLAPAELTS